MSATKPTALIVDHRTAVRTELEALLQDAGFAVTATAGGGGGGAHAWLAQRWDVVLLASAADDRALAREVLGTFPGTPVVLYADAGAQLGHVAGAIAKRGERVDPAAEPDPPDPTGPSEPADPTAVLTRREREVLSLLADGLSGPEIAERLFLSLETVRTHIRNAVTKLDARTRVRAAVMVALAADRRQE